MSFNGIIALHVGAGNHSQTLIPEYKKLMKSTCIEACELLKGGCSALDAVTHATTLLENSSLTNAGYGASLTMNGTVECDASVMEGSSCHFGAVGSISGVRNPILVAKSILEAQKVPMLGGLVPPSLLAGDGARAWAKAKDIPLCESADLVSEKAKRVHKDSVSYLQSLQESRKRRKIAENHEQLPESPITSGNLLDTVGSVALDCRGSVASAVSSGGILLKHPGRVGQAAIFGCGCWAQDDYEGSGMNVAVSTTGCGEHLIKTDFGRVCARATLETDALGEVLARTAKQKFIDSPLLRDRPSPMGGCLSLKHDPERGLTDLFWLHTTNTMGVAFMKVGDNKCSTTFSELPDERVGQTFALNCKSFSHDS